jgi:acyl carrier protein
VSDADVIMEFIRDELLEDDIDIDEDTSLFRDQLLDSMNLTALIVFLEQTFAIKIKAMDIVYENLDSVRHMLAFIERKRAAQPA